MNRRILIQAIFRNPSFKNYLEIGVQNGRTLFRIKAQHKTAVDPCFNISLFRKIKWILRAPNNINNVYFEETSDDFFQKRKEYLAKKGKIDVALVDGLHTYRAALQDVLNTLKYLNRQGIIVIHDCFPPSEVAALPKEDLPTDEEMKKHQEWNGPWCGDAWKSIVYLMMNHQDILDICVINSDFGLGIVRIKKGKNPQELIINEDSFAEIDQLTYQDLIQDPEKLINLKGAEYAEKVIDDMTEN